MVKSRAPVINEDVIEVVTEILNTWSGKLTWDLLIAAIKKGIGYQYTRQALAGHKKIVEEFTLRKRALQFAAGRPAPVDGRTNTLQKKIDSLKAENELLIRECNNYRAMFIVWSHNAAKNRLSEEILNLPLPPSQQLSTDDVVPLYDPKRVKKR